MADQTNGNVPVAGGQISGDVAKQAAIKRLKKLQEQQQLQTGPPR